MCLVLKFRFVCFLNFGKCLRPQLLHLLSLKRNTNELGNMQSIIENDTWDLNLGSMVSEINALLTVPLLDSGSGTVVIVVSSKSRGPGVRIKSF